jgi:riboflavin kinase / FMN adenylyltransferase
MIEVDSISKLKSAGFKSIALACGNFDGLHRGHQKIIDQLLKVSKQKKSSPVVLTFSPHPREVLAGVKIPSLAANHTKKRLLAEMGIKALVSINFTLEFAGKTATEFIQDVLTCEDLEVTDICIGSQWRFAKKREGDVQFLKKADSNFEVHPVEELKDDQQVISSSRIREALGKGDFMSARQLLGREYSVCGPVIPGRGIATTELAFPTANVNIDEQFLPLAGVFACWVNIEDSDKKFSAVCNIGFAPTFGGDKNRPARVEVHILDFEEDIYGKNIEIEFVLFIRNEKKFDNIELLKTQIADDITKARQFFSSQG